MDRYEEILKELVGNYPELAVCCQSILDAYALLAKCFDAGNVLYTCGNGGSCADADHITGELLKGFCRRRPMPAEEMQALDKITEPARAKTLTAKLQQGLRAVSLMNFPAAASAVANDLGPDLAQAQLLYALGRSGDVLLAISTSGNAQNVANAVAVAKLKGMKVIGLTNARGGRLAQEADVVIKAPTEVTFRAQEYHLPVYHALCRMVEERYFSE